MQGQFRHLPHLSPVINATSIFTESRFLSVAQQIRAGNMMVVPISARRRREK
jgi:hypothetical protein